MPAGRASRSSSTPARSAPIPSTPRFPFREDDIWNGYPEETNAPYGVAKKAVFVMLDGYRREYGLALGRGGAGEPVRARRQLRSGLEPRDPRPDPQVRGGPAGRVPRRWSAGAPAAATREFLYVDDAAEGIVRAAEVMEEPVPINLGGGQEIAIRDLVTKIAAACGYAGRITWDTSKPDGQPRRALDISRARKLLGWEPRQDFDPGLAATVAWWRSQVGEAVPPSP